MSSTETLRRLDLPKPDVAPFGLEIVGIDERADAEAAAVAGLERHPY